MWHSRRATSLWPHWWPCFTAISLPCRSDLCKKIVCSFCRYCEKRGTSVSPSNYWPAFVICTCSPYKCMWKISCMTPKRIITTRQTTAMVKKGWITCYKAAGPPSPTYECRLKPERQVQRLRFAVRSTFRKVKENGMATSNASISTPVQQNITQNSQNHPRDQFNTPMMSTTDFICPTARLPPTHISHTPDTQEEKASAQKNHETIKRHGYCELQNAKKAQGAKANYWSCSN